LVFGLPGPSRISNSRPVEAAIFFVTKISTTRFNLVYSTYIGGNGADYATGIVVDQMATRM
jgi:hypothetical protein